MGVFHRVTVPLILHDLDRYIQQIKDIENPKDQEECATTIAKLALDLCKLDNIDVEESK